MNHSALNITELVTWQLNIETRGQHHHVVVMYQHARTQISRRPNPSLKRDGSILFIVVVREIQSVHHKSYFEYRVRTMFCLADPRPRSFYRVTILRLLWHQKQWSSMKTKTFWTASPHAGKAKQTQRRNKSYAVCLWYFVYTPFAQHMHAA